MSEWRSCGCVIEEWSKRREKKQSRPTPLPSRSLTSRFRAHAPQQCALSRRSRVTQVASEYPAMLRRSNLVSGGSVASARPLGTVRTLYPDTPGVSRGFRKMADPGPESPHPMPIVAVTAEPPVLPEPTGGTSDQIPSQEYSHKIPGPRGVAGWIVNDLGNTLFSQNMISNYFPVWVVAVMGGSDGHISLVNTITMALMLGIGPWLGAVSDRLPRRLPILIATTTGCCLITLLIGNDLQSSLILFLGANLLFQAGLVIYDSLLPAVSTPENRGRVGGAAVGLGYLGSLLGIGIGFIVLSHSGDYQTIFRLTAIGFFLLAL